MDLYFSAKAWLANMYKIFLVKVCVGISVGQWQEGTPYGDIVNNTYKPFFVNVWPWLATGQSG